MKLFLVLLPLLVCMNSFAQPILSIENQDRELGCIAYDSNNEFIYKIKNKGNEPLIITNVFGGDPFFASGIPKEPIMPGKSGKIVMKYDTKRVGNFNKTGTIYSNSITGIQTIKLKGEVLPFPAIQVSNQYFIHDDYTQQKDTFDWEIELTNNFREIVTITKIEGLDEHFKLEFKPIKLYPSCKQKLNVKVNVSGAKGKLEKHLLIFNNLDTVATEIYFRAWVNVFSPVEFIENPIKIKKTNYDKENKSVFDFQYINTTYSPIAIEFIGEIVYGNKLTRTNVERILPVECDFKKGDINPKETGSIKIVIPYNKEENYTSSIHKTIEVSIRNQATGGLTVQYLDCYIEH